MPAGAFSCFFFGHAKKKGNDILLKEPRIDDKIQNPPQLGPVHINSLRLCGSTKDKYEISATHGY